MQLLLSSSSLVVVKMQMALTEEHWIFKVTSNKQSRTVLHQMGLQEDKQF
jgi:hypothetical protein